MEMMEIVIKISKDAWKRISDQNVPDVHGIDVVNELYAIKRGIPLPEHHGRIIDESRINTVFYHTEEVINNNIKAISIGITHTDAPTIIEAESEKE